MCAAQLSSVRSACSLLALSSASSASGWIQLLTWPTTWDDQALDDSTKSAVTTGGRGTLLLPAGQGPALSGGSDRGATTKSKPPSSAACVYWRG